MNLLVDPSEREAEAAACMPVRLSAPQHTRMAIMRMPSCVPLRVPSFVTQYMLHVIVMDVCDARTTVQTACGTLAHTHAHTPFACMYVCALYTLPTCTCLT